MLDSADNLDDPPVLILGASTRAAAQSAVRAGLRPLCADLFADLDLRACAGVFTTADYPHGLEAAAAAAPPGPWMYTGGLENHPNLVARISKTRPLWGNGADVLRRIRDPWYVEELLRGGGLPGLRIWPRGASLPPADAAWVLKPLRGAAGRAIQVWSDRRADAAALHEPHYFQERRNGAPYSAVFLAGAAATRLLGITRQLVGLSAVHAPQFAWCGAIAPVALAEPILASVRQIGERLATRAGLRGLFGCDFLIDRGQPWLTEVNPRYPASIELIEYAKSAPLLDWHRRACQGAPGPDLATAGLPSECAERNPLPGRTTRPRRRHVFGKLILYAAVETAAPELSRFIHRPANWLRRGGDLSPPMPYLADIPAEGQTISRGHPVCTLFAAADREADCLRTLVRRAARLEARLKCAAERESRH